MEHLPSDELKDGLEEMIKSVFDTGVPRHLEQRLTTGRPVEVYVRTSIFPILSQTPSGNGESADYVVWMAEDITKKKELEASFLTSEKLSAVGELAAGVAHEVNNPLGGILNCLYNFKNKRLSEDRKAEYLDFMKDGIIRVQNIVRQLLDFSQQHVPELALIDINSMIEEMKPLFLHSTNDGDIKIITNLEHGLKPILADKHQVEQILVNLMLNAIQAVDGNGLIEVSTRSTGGWYCITVSDNGCGITADDMPRIFDPFFTTKGVGKGTGLGLSVSRGIIERHKGRIEVESRVGKGTVFRVYLPGSA
jgi:signal transduction histidine kinase